MEARAPSRPRSRPTELELDELVLSSRRARAARNLKAAWPALSVREIAALVGLSDVMVERCLQAEVVEGSAGRN